MRFLRTALALIGACLSCTLIGCKEDDVIRKDTILHEDREAILKHVAVFERDKAMWFFLLSGPEAEVQKNVRDFDAFVRSVKFEDEKDAHAKEPITWTDPKGWRKDPPGGMRYAGYRIDAAPKELEVTITRLPSGDRDALLPNINRWEKQINRPVSEDLASLGPHVTLKRDTIGAQAMTWVDLKGFGVHTVSKPPEKAAMNQRDLMPAPPMKKQARGGQNPFKYIAPEGWRRKQIAPRHAPGSMNSSPEPGLFPSDAVRAVRPLVPKFAA